jgi:hypothetical protein
LHDGDLAPLQSGQVERWNLRDRTQFIERIRRRHG